MTTGAGQERNKQDDSPATAVKYQCARHPNAAVVVSALGISCAYCGDWIVRYK